MMIFNRPAERPSVSEVDIQAYTDRSIAGERAVFVRRYLAARPGEWRRILFYRHLNAQIRRAFPHFDADPERAAAVRPGASRHVPLALASTVLLLAGAAAGWLRVSEPTPQVLYDAAVMALTEANSDAAGERPTHTEGMAPAPFDLHAAGLRLAGDSAPDLGPFALARRYVYENGEGHKIVLLGARAWFAKDEPQWSARRLGVLRLIAWTAHGMRWVLAGNAGTRGLMRAADAATMTGAGGGGSLANSEANGIEQWGEDGAWTSATN